MTSLIVIGLSQHQVRQPEDEQSHANDDIDVEEGQVDPGQIVGADQGVLVEKQHGHGGDTDEEDLPSG